MSWISSKMSFQSLSQCLKYNVLLSSIYQHIWVFCCIERRIYISTFPTNQMKHNNTHMHKLSSIRHTCSTHTHITVRALWNGRQLDPLFANGSIKEKSAHLAQAKETKWISKNSHLKISTLSFYQMVYCLWVCVCVCCGGGRNAHTHHARIKFFGWRKFIM